ncbi:MAG TPA: helix-turn-helix domain-containing protein, partial [Nanoarchaeota archaeon]|nr:helix-turn-helix domain-containing protein [Nanoarchaeota archaeon]
MDKRKKVLELHAQGFSIRKIERIVGVPKSTIHRWIKEPKDPKRLKFTEIYKSMSNSLKDKLKSLLLYKTEEKGKSRTLSNAQIYEIIRGDLLAESINLKKKVFYEFLKYFTIREFGSLEKLEKQRRLKKEISKFVQSKGTVKREAGLWEIDAT